MLAKIVRVINFVNNVTFILLLKLMDECILILNLLMWHLIIRKKDHLTLDSLTLWLWIDSNPMV